MEIVRILVEDENQMCEYQKMFERLDISVEVVIATDSMNILPSALTARQQFQGEQGVRNFLLVMAERKAK